MDKFYLFLYVLLGIVTISLLAFIIYSIFKSPFTFPYYTVTFDVSGKRSPNINDLIDDYLNKKGFDEFNRHYQMTLNWKTTCQENIKNSILHKLRLRQFERTIDDDKMFRFEIIRKQTRYRQTNYVKSPYIVQVLVGIYTFNLQTLQQRFVKLSNIHFECTLSEYHSKEQRKRMTKTFREQIALRDNYTCHICGKYMPDGVGLHIDHIIPVAKGGKSVSSNLQVLCSKCNGRKHVS